MPRHTIGQKPVFAMADTMPQAVPVITARPMVDFTPTHPFVQVPAPPTTIASSLPGPGLGGWRVPHVSTLSNCCLPIYGYTICILTIDNLHLVWYNDAG
jgi:hypothetical protein